MKDSQRGDDGEVVVARYIKVNNERFSTQGAGVFGGG